MELSKLLIVEKKKVYIDVIIEIITFYVKEISYGNFNENKLFIKLKKLTSFIFSFI